MLTYQLVLLRYHQKTYVSYLFYKKYPKNIYKQIFYHYNDIFLLNCKKLEAITNENNWKSMVKELVQSFHSFLNLHASQMTSYFKNLDICEELTTFTFFGNIEKYKDLHRYVINRYLKYSVLIFFTA